MEKAAMPPRCKFGLSRTKPKNIQVKAKQTLYTVVGVESRAPPEKSRMLEGWRSNFRGDIG